MFYSEQVECYIAGTGRILISGHGSSGVWDRPWHRTPGRCHWKTDATILTKYNMLSLLISAYNFCNSKLRL